MAVERVKIDREGGVAEVRLVRGDKHNALDLEMFRSIAAAQAELRADSAVRAVVLHGEGPSFCSGLDLGAVATGALEIGTLIDRPLDEVANLAQTAAHGWRTLPFPVVAAIHGACFGGGLQIALGADLRISAADARLSVMEVKLGLLPDMAISASLPRLVRADVAKELAWSGREVSGTEAVELGLVTRVADPPLAAARELAGKLATKSPHAIRAIKRLFDQAWNEPPERSLRLETELVRTLLGSPNQIEAARAAIAGEQPSFADPEL
ncbi:MAG: crotonase/enoyl-CoA hydratase family protein [Solirubrobacterales bacterium]